MSDPQRDSRQWLAIGLGALPYLIGVSLLLAASEELIEGLVLEVSQGGLGLSLKKPVEVGQEVDVRVTTSPAAPWVPVEVRHCSSAGPRWNVGCRFTRELEPAVRGLFG